MDAVLSNLAECNPNGNGELKHEQLSALLKNLDPTFWSDDSIKLLLENLPDPVRFDKFLEFLFSAGVRGTSRLDLETAKAAAEKANAAAQVTACAELEAVVVDAGKEDVAMEISPNNEESAKEVSACAAAGAVEAETEDQEGANKTSQRKEESTQEVTACAEARVETAKADDVATEISPNNEESAKEVSASAETGVVEAETEHQEVANEISQRKEESTQEVSACAEARAVGAKAEKNDVATEISLIKEDSAQDVAGFAETRAEEAKAEQKDGTPEISQTQEERAKEERSPSKESLRYNEPHVEPNCPLKALIGQKKWQFSDFNLLETVGTGTFGRVRLVKVKDGPDTTTPFALKILQKTKVMQLQQVEHVNAEKDILMQINHPFIVNLLTVFQDEKRLFMLLEYVNGGELFSLLRRKGRLPSGHAMFYSGEIVLAFEYLHDLHIVYRDLKPENLLINSDGNIKIADFGFAKMLQERTWTLCGTPEYLAPEIIQSKGHGLPVDWWALGILIYEMLAGYPPFYDDQAMGIYQKILAGRVDFSNIFDPRAKDIIKSLLIMDRRKRLGCFPDGSKKIKRHKWYKDVDWDQLLSGNQKPPWKPVVKSACDTAHFDDYPESAESSAPGVTEEEQVQFASF